MAKLLELKRIDKNYFKDKNAVAVIGFFDGVHLGHRKILESCIEKAKKINGVSIVLTFNKPPLNVIKSELSKKLIISYEEKIKILSGLGVDYIVTANFDSGFLKMEPDMFCRDILIGRFHIKDIFAGNRFNFGFKTKGNILFLKRFLKPYDIKVNVVPLLKIKNEVVSSTNIRKYYSQGEISKIKNLLGRDPQVQGIVVKGAGRGRQLGFPTANIDICEIFMAPKDGVYLGTVEIDGSKYKPLPSIINVGDNPTFKESKKWIEAFIINFKGNIYQKKIRISFLKRLRDEIVFESKEELINQMKLDLKYAGKYFNIKI
ncbi:MAG: bifunctional riboflavin kinase/FAD synthetase [Actinomycetota bacterium]|nr:bifunctional riboflavin kinase/FAD synthetase [Actinomycetota bacterium]